ncbi:dephospho-CoA kinase [Desulfurivibrio sp. C05AmB]|uniref:dephospho-CoA kinase n=1 Tax=Desulfurivibrio sp. C05AmB TaxID=3374371 RepID=UPI00376EDEDB
MRVSENNKEALGGLVAITGGIAAGKSRVAQYLMEHAGLSGIDVDHLSRQLLEPDQAGWLALERNFGSRFFRADRTIDRKLLRRAIFTDPRLRSRIDRLLHPLIRAAMQVRAAELRRAGAGTVLVEVPLLYEAGWEDDFSLVLVVWAPEEVCLQRLCRRDEVCREEARATLAAQMPQAEKVRRADLVVENSADWPTTCQQLDRLIPRLQKAANRPVKPAGDPELSGDLSEISR